MPTRWLSQTRWGSAKLEVDRPTLFIQDGLPYGRGAPYWIAFADSDPDSKDMPKNQVIGLQTPHLHIRPVQYYAKVMLSPLAFLPHLLVILTFFGGPGREQAADQIEFRLPDFPPLDDHAPVHRSTA